MTVKTDYLVESKIIPFELIKNESTSEWITILKDEEVQDESKEFVTFFLIPYKISFMKFLMNLNYLQDHLNDSDQRQIDLSKNEKAHISPRLRVLLENIKDINPGYSQNFLAAFPDVVSWANEGDGFKKVQVLYNNMGKMKLITNEFFIKKALFWIIEEYLENTEKDLECCIYNNRFEKLL